MSNLDRISHVEVGKTTLLHVKDRAEAIRRQQQISATSRYPKHMKGREFKTKLYVARPLEDALALPTLFLAVTRVK